MESTLSPNQLTNLAEHLESHLHQEHQTQFETLQLNVVPLQIYCVLKGKDLMVLGQHRPDQIPQPAQVFPSLETAIHTLPPELMADIFDPQILPCRIQVKLYLRSKGQKQPYAMHPFTFVPVFIPSLEDLEHALAQPAVEHPDAAPGDPNQADLAQDLAQGNLAQEDAQEDAQGNLAQANLAPVGAAYAHLASGEAAPANLAFGEAAPEDGSSSGGAALHRKAPWPPAELPPEVEALEPPESLFPQAGEFPDWVPDQAEPDFSARSSDLAMADAPSSAPDPDGGDPPLPWLAIAGVGGLAAVLSGWFVMTRPCVIDTCQPLQAASQLNWEMVKTVESARSVADLKRAQTQLAQITQQLQRVPRWSGRFSNAQALLQRSQTQSTELDRVITALDKAAQASQAAEAGTPSGAGKEDAANQRTLWQTAIVQLETIPKSSMLYEFAQARLTEFQDNLNTLEGQGLSTAQAKKRLLAAKAAAQKAQERQSAAQTQEDWQLTQATWLTAIKALQEIPPTADSYREAQQLLPTYRAEVTGVGNRLVQLQQSYQAYTQALAIADRARALEQQNQWTMAVVTWRNALSRAQQVPADSPDAAQAQTLISAYSSALSQAEGQLQAAIAQQRVKTDLEKACTGSVKICTFAIAPEVIRLQFTPTYEQALSKAYAAGESTDPNTYSKTLTHIDTLQTALQTICNNAGIPLEVYSANGNELVGSFDPQG
jgi:tetratricopeptide (TPR) repeat protein